MFDLGRILDGLPVGVWVGDVQEGKLLYSNEAFERIAGMPAIAGKPLSEAAGEYGLFDRHNEPYPVEKLLFRRAMTNAAPIRLDDIVMRRGGHTKNIRAFGAPLLDATGEISHVIVALSDITEEISARREWEEVKDRLTFVCNHAPISIWSTDLNGTVTLSEGAALASLGVKPGQLVGSNIFELYKDHPTGPGHFRRALAGDSFWYTAGDGNVTFESWLTPLRNESGAMVGLAGFSNDVTELRSLQATVVKNDRVHALGTLAASMAHEINNPLTYIMGHGEAVSSELDELEGLLSSVYGPALPKIQAALARIREELAPVLSGTARIASITQDLQSFTRPDDTTLTDVNVSDAIDSVIKLIGKDVRAQAKLTIGVEQDLHVRCNESQLVQVVFNLILNAKQALPLDSSSPQRIDIQGYSKGSNVIIDVVDTGLGVPDIDRERIFEPMFSTKDVGTGTGLGLFVCRNIARSLSGDIEVSSGSDGGALFRVTLPRSTPQSLAESRSNSSEKCVTADGHVLLIDDDPLVLRVLASKLKRGGFRVTTFENAHSALEFLVKSRDIDLIFCDLMMPDMTGMDFAAAVAEQLPNLKPKLLFMTGGAFSPRAQEFVKENSQHVLRKPFDVIATTRRWLA